MLNAFSQLTTMYMYHIVGLP